MLLPSAEQAPAKSDSGTDTTTSTEADEPLAVGYDPLAASGDGVGTVFGLSDSAGALPKRGWS
jgi:hypothetical protein